MIVIITQTRHFHTHDVCSLFAVFEAMCEHRGCLATVVMVTGARWAGKHCTLVGCCRCHL